ncbi:TcdA/TcdB catalytic glycosyltransferase domain-containing protein [Vibrio sp. T11.5]|uniref:TcdA/TcdB catalytic glycosyltransferase domain-containing protein n=1 Tax=Vibrio sp. T11.5 TaxID=2998836 RepID=UPI0022CD2F1D|nr:TcdA/TcdB catalytic glycosyltransferase domain-containing protein [Vibrio sp. T11.5]MDA0118302.1 glycosyltransferase [Vibrio sp. T11.5]
MEKIARNVGFFIWIGEPNNCISGYINIWKKSYPNSDFELWIDPSALLANKINDVILCGKSSIEERLSCQDRFHSYCRYNSGNSIDTNIIEYSKIHKPEITESLIKHRRKIESDLLSVKNNLNIRYLSENSFYNKETYRLYQKEITLRQNLASASDLARLSLLYKMGGTYIDVDTLPCLKDTHQIHHINKNSITELVLSESILCKIEPNSRTLSCEQLKHLIDIIKKDCFINFYYITKAIHRVDSFPKFSSLPTLCSNDALHLSVKDDAEFNNNILRCHKQSRLVRIIIKECLRRYRYIELWEYDKPISTRVGNSSYYNRLKNYRLDGLQDIENATLLLSGPVLILEVIIGVYYSLSSTDKNISESEVCTLIQNAPFNLGIRQQTRMTGQETRSSWLKTV